MRRPKIGTAILAVWFLCGVAYQVFSYYRSGHWGPVIAYTLLLIACPFVWYRARGPILTTVILYLCATGIAVFLSYL